MNLKIFSLSFSHPNWAIVRIIGELKILTKASYGALVIIPLIAGLWPLISEHIHFRVLKWRNALSDSGVAESNRIEELLLPESLVFIFLSSLFIIFGHLLYQIFAIENVQKNSAKEFATQSVDNFHRNMIPEIINKEKEFLRSINKDREVMILQKIINESDIKIIENMLSEYSNNSILQSEKRMRLLSNFIYQASIVRYSIDASRPLFFIYVSFTFYLLGFFYYSYFI